MRYQHGGPVPTGMTLKVIGPGRYGIWQDTEVPAEKLGDVFRHGDGWQVFSTAGRVVHPCAVSRKEALEAIVAACG